METLEGNKLIAEFMGNYVDTESHNAPLVSEPSGNYYYLNDCEYRTSWEWLMPVVEKIEADADFLVHISKVSTLIMDNRPIESVEVCHVYSAVCGGYKQMIWQAVVQFIQWYNQQNLSNGK